MLVRLERIGKTYRSGALAVPALRHITLTIERGEFVAIIGQSGSGKTTLLDILGCLSRPTEGEYWLAGKPVASLEDRELAAIRNRQMGFIFQSFHLLPRKTALHNVELPLQYAGLPAEERRAGALAMLERVGLGDRIAHYPNQLSGGQQQRVAIARALVTRPALLLADEPTGSLDSRSGREIIEMLQALHRGGQTIVLITHAGELAQMADRIITISDGEVRSDERRAAALIGWGRGQDPPS
jgi:ABC-type lipoprotein export system ATPase subunit